MAVVEDLTQLDYQTGKLDAVAQRIASHRRREYRLLWAILVLTGLPVLLLGVWRPVWVLCVLLFAAYFVVLSVFAKSTSTLTSHHIRFLLAGSNPIGMTGASSLMFGAVDALIDWREDRESRRRNPIRFWALFIYKFVMTPVGLVLVVLEYAWDVCLLMRPRIVPLKWNELFSLAWYHNLICPEKSNDIFYADMAFARYCRDPHRYQWNRLRALVFELEHYRIDFESGLGVPETNVFWQDDVTAYQTLKRLRLEELERAVAEEFSRRPTMLPIPSNLGTRLIQNARPLRHYLRMRSRLTRSTMGAWEVELQKLFQLDGGAYCGWHVLRLMDEEREWFSKDVSPYVTEDHLRAMVTSGILELPDPDGFQYRYAASFREALDGWLDEFCVPVSSQEAEDRAERMLPTVLQFNGVPYIPRQESG